MRRLPQAQQEAVLGGFRKISHRKGHIFCEQKAAVRQCVHLVVGGSVEICRREEHSLPSGVSSALGRRVGVLVQGGLFGSLNTSPGALPLSVVASSSSCDVLHAEGRSLRRLPPEVRLVVREALERTQAWHRGDGDLGAMSRERSGSEARSSSVGRASDSDAGRAVGLPMLRRISSRGSMIPAGVHNLDKELCPGLAKRLPRLLDSPFAMDAAKHVERERCHASSNQTLRPLRRPTRSTSLPSLGGSHAQSTESTVNVVRKAFTDQRRRSA